MHFYFVRHGQSENNLLWAQGSSNKGRVADPALTTAGERQAEMLARFLAAPTSPGVLADEDPQGFRITHIYTSLTERAVATGHRIAEALNLPLYGWIDIHETGGMFLHDEETDTYIPQPGRSRGYLLEYYPRLALPDEVTAAGWWNRPFEPKDACAPRARRVLHQLQVKHENSDDGVVFVSHGGFFNYLLRAIMDLPVIEPEQPLHPLWFAANNASITHIAFADDRRVVEYLNRVDFLPADLIT